MQDVTKIYRIEVPGIEAAIGKMQQLNQEIALSKAIKQEAQKVLLANPSDTDAIEKQSRIIAENEVAIRKLNAEKQVAQKQTDLLIKASKEQAVADTNTAAAAKLAAGSYNQLYASYKSLFDQYKATPPTSPLFEQVKQNAIEAKQKVDEFNRSLSPDGTLVGEYKTGILNAFKQLGLMDVIKDQKSQIEASIKQLIERNKELAKEYESAGKTGKASMLGIENQIKSNIETQQKLQANLNTINNTLNEGGGIGAKFTAALNNGFKEVIAAGLSVIGIGIGLHEVFDFIKDSIKEFEEADRITKQFENTLTNLGRLDALPGLKQKMEDLRLEFTYLNESDLTKVTSKLIDFGKLTANQINQLLPIIVNYSAKSGKTLSESAELIIKALAGSAKGLQDFGIKVSQNSTFAERLNIVLTTLAEKVEGGAKAFEHSAAGSIADTEEQIKELHETIGSKALPVWAGFLDFINHMIDGFGVLKDKIKDVATELLNPANSAVTFAQLMNDAFDPQDPNKPALDPKEFAIAQAETIKRQIKDRTQQYVDIIREGVFNGTKVTAAAAIKGLEESLKKGTDNAFQVAVNKGILDNLKAKYNPAILGIDLVNEDEARKARLKRVQEIEAEAVEEQIILEKKKLKGTITEEQYQADLFKIIKKADEQKLAVLTKGSTEELKQANQIKLQLIQREDAYNKELFTRASDRIAAQKNLEIQSAKETLDKTLNNKDASQIDRNKAQTVFDEQVLKIQTTFNSKMDDLEKQFNIHSVKNAADRKIALSQINDQIAKDLVESYRLFFENQLAIIKFQEDFKKNTIESIKQQQVLGVLKNEGESEIKSQIELIKILSQASLDSINVEIDATKKQIFQYQLRYGALAAVLPQYQALVVLLNQLNTDAQQEKINAVNEIVSKVPTPSGQGTETFLTDQISKALGFDDKTDVGDQANKKLIGQVIASSFSTATLAMNSYFDLEQHRIEQSKQLAYDRIDLETKIAKGRAQSQAELDAIDVQAAAKKKAADQKALEETKKLKKAEAKIALATELANIAVAASQNPLNGPTLGTAGIAEYSLLAALAFARYFINVGSINQATSFAKGGSLNEVLGNGGVFGGNSHAHGGNKFMYGNLPVETEAREAYVINKNATWDKGTYTVTGTPLQIASAINTIGGGRPFANNVQYRKMEFGGLLGENLQAPVNPGSFLGNLSGNNNLDDVKNLLIVQQGMIMSVSDQTNKRIDKIQVVQQTRTVRSAIAKEVRNESIATL